MAPIDKNTNFKLANLTDVGSPQTNMDFSKGLEKAVFNLPNGPDKINFYNQISGDDDKQSMIDVLTIYKKERGRLEKIANLKDAIVHSLKKRIRHRNGESEPDIQKDISKLFKTNMVTQELDVAKGGNAYKDTPIIGGGGPGAPIPKTPANDPPAEDDDGLLKDIKTLANEKTDNDKEISVEEFDENPLYSKKTSEIGSIDRIIFIVGTYFIRSITLFMIEWAINSHMITSFKQCFTAYVTGYIALFMVWVLLANVNETIFETNIVLSSLFYYINTKVHSSNKFRIGIHIVVQLILLPLLFIIKNKSAPIDQDSFEQRRAIYQAISNLTFFTWIMTSIIASRF
jgi:uncharacterized protein YihD (DUF1040 family)